MPSGRWCGGVPTPLSCSTLLPEFVTPPAPASGGTERLSPFGGEGAPKLVPTTSPGAALSGGFFDDEPTMCSGVRWLGPSCAEVHCADRSPNRSTLATASDCACRSAARPFCMPKGSPSYHCHCVPKESPSTAAGAGAAGSGGGVTLTAGGSSPHPHAHAACGHTAIGANSFFLRSPP